VGEIKKIVGVGKISPDGVAELVASGEIKTGNSSREGLIGTAAGKS